MGHCLLMGRKTYESIGRPLPGRTSIVISRNPDYDPHPEVVVVPSLEAALAAARSRGESEAFVFGGEAIYAARPAPSRTALSHPCSRDPGRRRVLSGDRRRGLEVVAEEEEASSGRAPRLRVHISGLDRKRRGAGLIPSAANAARRKSPHRDDPSLFIRARSGPRCTGNAVMASRNPEPATNSGAVNLEAMEWATQPCARRKRGVKWKRSTPWTPGESPAPAARTDVASPAPGPATWPPLRRFCRSPPAPSSR